jgi:arylsulfatase A-like enzyme
MRAVGPDFPAGEDLRLVGNIDLAPTFAAIAGAERRDDWDGRSLRRQDGLDRQVIGLESFDRYPRGDLIPPYHGFRSTTGLVYIEYTTGEIELYDLINDPYQLENLAAGKVAADFPAHRARVAELSRCRAEACWSAEDAPLGVL